MTRIPHEDLEKRDRISEVMKLSPDEFIKKYIWRIKLPIERRDLDGDDEWDPNKYITIGKLKFTSFWSTGMGHTEIKYGDELVYSSDVYNFFFKYGDWMIEYLDYLYDNNLLILSYFNTNYWDDSYWEKRKTILTTCHSTISRGKDDK